MYTLAFMLAVITALASFATATPPACFLAAVMEQPNPADTKAICGSLEPQMASNLTSKCSGDAFSAAVSVYTSTCKAAQSVDITISSPSPSGTQTGSSTAAATSATTTGPSGAAAGTTTGMAATASTTGKNGASRISNQSTCLWISTVLGFGFAAQYLL